jgi:phage/plasmid primase-like uncharacterized protein
MFGRVSGGSVRLQPMGPDGVLGIAEGLESAASFAVVSKLPCWAALSTSGLANWEPPKGLRRLIIGADNDASGAGERAAERLGERLSARGVRVSIVTPPDVGDDWNSVIDRREVSR